MRRTTFDPLDYTANIMAAYERATDTQLAEGRAWYADASAVCRAIAERTDHSVATVAAVVSALSPRNKWARNVVDAAAYCEAARDGRPMPIACTYGANMRKAWAIATANDPSILSGRKVESFIANITGDWSRVTVDVWAIRCATDGASDAVKCEGEYRAVESAYQTVAAEVGLTPAELQAVCWVVVRSEYVRKSRKAA